jgi:stage IV sporulation protein FB
VIRAIRQRLAGFGSPNRGVLFVVLGYAVRIHPSFWLIAFLIGWQRSTDVAGLFAGVLVVLVSILVHELGHALTAGRWGVVYRISVHGGGGETTWKPVGEVSWWQHLVVSLAGPAAGFSLALLAWLLEPHLRGNGVMGPAATDLVQVNLAWGVFNLLPIVPLDGGQALKSWLVAWWYERGEWVSAAIGVLTAIMGLLAAVVTGQVWAALVLGIYGIHNGQVLGRHYETYRDAHTHTKWLKLPARDQARERY